MKRNKRPTKKEPISKTCIVALMVAGLFVADETGQGQINWILGVFVLLVIGWAAVELLYAMEDEN